MSLRLFLILAVLSAAAHGAVRITRQNGRWLLENPRLRVTVDAGAGRISVHDKAARRDWRQSGPAEGSPREFRAAAATQDGVSFEADFPDGAAGTRPLKIRLTLAEEAADLRMEADMHERGTAIEALRFLDPFVLDAPEGALVVADYSNGHLYPLSLQPFPKKRFGFTNIDMPWLGICDLAGGAGYAAIAETPDDGYFAIETVEGRGGPLAAPRVVWTASKRAFAYPRRLLYHFASRGGYVALAKRYRAHAKEIGVWVPLAEKVRKNPEVARLFGAPDIWGDGSLAFAREAKEAGVAKMIIHTSPSVRVRRGVTPADMKEINALGYLSSTYDNYTDVMPVESGREVDSTHDRVPEHVVLRADGQRMTAWLTWDKKQFMKRCPSFWVPSAKVVIPQDLAVFPYVGRFIDVTTAEDLYECYDPAHPLTRAEKREEGVKLLGYVRSLGLVTGGEHGRWWAVPVLDYIEGMMSGGSASWPAGHLTRPKSKDQEFVGPSGNKYPKWEEYERWGIGHQYRVPLWELVFHDCIVTTWYWGDSNDFLIVAAPEVTQKKDAFNILYGTIPMMWANSQGSWQAAREVFLRTYRNTCKLHEAIAGTEMLDHEFLTADRAVQRTRFADGTVAVVNFGAAPYRAQVAGKSYLLPQNGFAVKGPRIEQSLALVDGRPVTTVRAGSYHYTDGAPQPR